MFKWHKLQLLDLGDKPVVYELPGGHPITSQEIGGWVAQPGNFIMLYNAVVLGDTASIISTLPAFASDRIMSWARNKNKAQSAQSEEAIKEQQRRWEAKCYSTSMAIVAGLLTVFRMSQAAAGNPAFKRAVMAQMVISGFGALRYPAERAGEKICMSYPRAGEWIKRMAHIIPAMVTVGMVPIRIALITSLGLLKPETYTPAHGNILRLWTSPEGKTLRLLTGQGFFGAADIFKGDIPSAMHEIKAWIRPEPPARPKVRTASAHNGGPE